MQRVKSGAWNGSGRRKQEWVLVRTSFWKVLSTLEESLLLSKEWIGGNSPAVRWLGLRAVTVRARVQSLAGELRSHKRRGQK